MFYAKNLTEKIDAMKTQTDRAECFTPDTGLSLLRAGVGNDVKALVGLGLGLPVDGV